MLSGSCGHHGLIQLEGGREGGQRSRRLEGNPATAQHRGPFGDAVLLGTAAGGGGRWLPRPPSLFQGPLGISPLAAPSGKSPWWRRAGPSPSPCAAPSGAGVLGVTRATALGALVTDSFAPGPVRARESPYPIPTLCTGSGAAACGRRPEPGGGSSPLACSVDACEHLRLAGAEGCSLGSHQKLTPSWALFSKPQGSDTVLTHRWGVFLAAPEGRGEKGQGSWP